MEEVFYPGRFLVCASPDQVEVWSVTRLPFEPQGWLLEMRGCIREAVRSMRCGPQELLEGVYTSQDRSLCDAENVLLYNIGTSYFAGLCGSGLRFNRSFSSPPEPPQDFQGIPLHHMSYRTVPIDEPFALQRRTIAKCRTELELGTSLGVAEIWLAVRHGEITVTSSASAPRPFGVSATLKVPGTRIPNAAGLTKSLLDGLLCAFHVHDGSMLEEVTRRIAERLGIAEHDVARHLMEREQAVLGRRRLVTPWGRSVQWNPADDLCVAAEVLVGRINESERTVLTAELFEVAAKAPPAPSPPASG